MPRSSATRTGFDDFTPFTPTNTGAGGTPPWNLNAPPQGGQGPFGKVPGPIGLPPVYNDVAGVFPNLSGNIGALSKNISSELAGELDPQTIAMLQNTAAQFGIGQGTPLSPFSGAQGLRHLGQTVEAQKAKGMEHLLAALPTLAKTLTVSPETQLDVADRNSKYNAAPDPEAAAREAQRLFEQYMARLMRGSGGGGMTFGGSGVPRNTNAPATDFINTPWAAFQPPAVGGTRPTTTPYAGSGINWGTQMGAGDQGPLLGGAGQIESDYWDDWFGWDPGAGSTQPDFGYLDEWGSGG